jgi:hypothetical protein
MLNKHTLQSRMPNARARRHTIAAAARTWLWSGKGMIEAQTPRMREGWISQCV